MKKTKSKNKFTLRIILSYSILGALALIASIFILSEVRNFLFANTSVNSGAKLIKTSSLLTQIYEAEGLSKLALQTKTKENFTIYSKKIDSISTEIESLKQVINSDYQLKLLDSVQYFLKQKTYNNKELRQLKLRNESNNPLDTALKKFKSLELSLNRITPHSLAPNLDELSPKAQEVIKNLAVYLNKNVPKNTVSINNSEKIDSIINTSKALLNEIKEKDALTLRSLTEKEKEINKNDSNLSQQLRSIISAFEQEIINATYADNLKKQAVLNRSTRLAGIAALLGFIVVGIFTFLITRDYWRVQSYRLNLEKEKKFSESLLKSREQLITTVSHDIRTPINTITGFSELIENTGLTEKQLGYMKNVKSATQYVDSLVNDLLDFSKLEAGKLKIENIPFILSDLIRETALNLKEANKKKNITLSIKIDEKLNQAVIGDPFRIRQILTNLISNAYKFTKEGYIKVVVSVEENEIGIDKTKIQVLDSGIGIEKEKQQHIFKEFAQADDNSEEKYGGYGLGLTISKKLTELLKGTLSLESEKNKGSVFTFAIPLEFSKNKFITTKKQVHHTLKSGLSILIIDDDVAMLHLLKEICNSLHIEAITFSNFVEINEELKLQYDVVLTDIQMPKIDGFSVLNKLKSGKFKHYKNQPIIAMTGRKGFKKEIYNSAGFRATLQKPFSKDEFLEKIRNLFPKIILNTNTIKNTSSSNIYATLYSLEPISSFLDGNNEEIKEVIKTFLKDTENNLQLLKRATDSNNLTTINSISHKMLPMFRQLLAKDCIFILEEYEHLKKGDLSKKEILFKFKKLQNNIVVLRLALQNNPIIHLNYND